MIITNPLSLILEIEAQFAATRMDLEIIILKRSKSERQIPYDITYMWDLKYDTNEHIYENRNIHRYREQTCGCQGGGEWGTEGLGVWD